MICETTNKLHYADKERDGSMLLLHLFSKKLCMYVMFYTWVKKSLK